MDSTGVGSTPSTPNFNVNSNSSDHLSGSFFIFDDYHSEDEEASGEELLLFFYPSHVTLNKRLFLLGGCSALVAFAKNFTSAPVEVLKMEKVKFAIKEEGKMIMALTTDISDPDSAVVNHLELIYNAFKFFNGSFSSVKEVRMRLC